MASSARRWLSARRDSIEHQERDRELDRQAESPLLEDAAQGSEKGEQRGGGFGFPDPASCTLPFSMGIFILSICFYAFRLHTAVTDGTCQARMWPFSPANDAMEFEWRQFDAEVIPHEFLGVPTTERRATWHRLWETGRMSFPFDSLPSINKSKESRDWWRLPPLRDNEVVGMSEAMHQLHCLNVLLLFVHRDEWDFRSAMNITENFFEVHSRHCSVMLLNMIKCRADVSPVLFQLDGSDRKSGSGLGRWKTRDAPRRCKNFHVLAQWLRDNQLCPLPCLPEDIASIKPA